MKCATIPGDRGSRMYAVGVVPLENAIWRFLWRKFLCFLFQFVVVDKLASGAWNAWYVRSPPLDSPKMMRIRRTRGRGAQTRRRRRCLRRTEASEFDFVYKSRRKQGLRSPAHFLFSIQFQTLSRKLPIAHGQFRSTRTVLHCWKPRHCLGPCLDGG